MAFEADGSKVPILGVRYSIALACRPYGLRGRWEQGAHLGSKVCRPYGLRGRWEQGAHLGSKVCRPYGLRGRWEQGAHLVSKGRVNLLLYGSTTRRERPLPVDPREPVPDLRVDEGGEELFGYGLIGADESSEAAGIFHFVNGLLLGLLRFFSPALGLGKSLFRLLSQTFGGCELLLQLLDPLFGRSDLLLEGHDLLFPDARQKKSDVLGNLFAEAVARPPHDGLHVGHLVPYLIDEGRGQCVPLVQAFVKLGRSGTGGALWCASGNSIFFRVVESSTSAGSVSEGSRADELATAGAGNADGWGRLGVDELASPGAERA
nr:hypothetical protein Iba_chr14cCG4130 [Ipomoea batatas]